MRKFKYYLLFFVLLIVSPIKAQDLMWAAKIGGTGSVYPFKSITDSQNNIYLIGYYTGNISQGVFNYNSNSGSQDIFVAKFDKNGVLVWMNSYGGKGFDDAMGVGLSPDETTLYITGYFQYDCYYSPTEFVSVTGLQNSTNEDSYLALLNTISGNISSFNKIAWDLTASSSQRIRGLKVTSDNKLVIFGSFLSEIYFSNSNLIDASGKTQNFIAKINPDGSSVWLKQIIGSGANAQNTLIYSLDISSNGYYFGGYYRNDLQFDLGTISSLNGTMDIFLYKTDINGNGLFLKRISGSTAEFLTSVSVDENENVFIGGYTNTTTGGINVDSTGTISTPISSTLHPNSLGNNDLLFAKYNSSGILQWFNTGGSTNADYIYRAISKKGLFIVAGRYGASFTFRGNLIPYSGGTSDGLGLVYDSGDNLVYYISFGGSGAETGRNANIDTDGNYIFVGDFSSSTLTISGTNLSNSGSTDIFLAKYRKGSLDKFSTNITCRGGANGAISVSPRGPLTPPYTYTWTKDGSPITPTDPENLTGLSYGTYNLAFLDSEGFSINESFNITEPVASLSVTAPTVNNVNCFGNPTGSVTLSASGGTSPYTYNKDGGAYQSSATFSSLRADVYSFGVKDANGCTATVNVTITEPVSPLTVTLTGTASSGSDGTATAFPDGGTSTYTYSWNPTGQTNQTATGLAPGTYTVTVTDSKTCQVTGSIGISSMIATVAKTNITCNGLTNGTATVTVSGGASPYTYELFKGGVSQGAAGSANTFSGLTAGNDYSVTVTDATTPTPNTASTTFTITEPAVLLATLNETNITCNGYNDGSIETVVSGGTAPFTYSWKRNGVSYANTADILNLQTGYYELTLTDKNNCSDVKGKTISTQSNLSVSLTATNAKCYLGQGSTSGSIASSVSGASGSWTYLWNNGKTTASITANPGNYSLTVTDGIGCKATATSAISYGPQISGSIDIISAPCGSNTNGSLKFTPALTGNGGLTYLWNKGQTTQIISNLAAGNYSVTVADSKNCQYSSSKKLDSNPLPTASLSGSATVCAGTSTTLTLTLTGTAPWNVTYNAGSTPVAINDINTSPYTFDVTPTTTTTYSITAVSDSHCNGTDFGTSATITVNPLPVPTITGTVNPVCEYSTGMVYTTETGMTGYTWTVTGGTITSGGEVTDNSVTIDWGASGTPASISVNYTDGNGCTATLPTSKTVIIRPLPVATINPNGAQSICQGSSITLNANTGLGLSYEWFKDASKITGETLSYLNVSTEGTYYSIVTNSFNCSSTSPTAVITIKPIPTASISTSDNLVWCENDAISVNMSATEVLGATYQWYRNNNAIPGSTSSTYHATQSGIYNAQVTLNGCEAVSNDIEVVVNPLPLSTLSTTDPIAYCEGSTISSNLSASPSDGDTYKWYLDGTLIDGATTSSFTATQKGAYTVEITKTGCSAVSSATTIVINPLPTVTLTPFSSVCKNATPFALTGGDPAGGTYSMGGAPIVNFDPSTTGSGDFTITYTFTDVNSCTNTASSTITVYTDLVAGSISGDQTICSGGDPIAFTSTTSPTGGDGNWTYSWESLVGSGTWTPVANSSFPTYDVPSGLAETTQYRRVETNSCGTVYSNTVTVSINPSPTVTLGAFNEVCEGSSSFVLTGGSPEGGTYLFQGNTITSFDPVTAGAGTHTIKYSYTNVEGCTSTASSTITVNPLPFVSVNATGKIVYCQGETISVLLTAVPSGATLYQWRKDGTDISGENNETYTATSAGVFSVFVTDAKGCSNSGSIGIISNPTPVIDIAAGVDTVKINTNEQYTFNAGAGYATYLWNDGSTSQTLTAVGSALGAGIFTYWAEVTNSAGCSARDTAILKVTWPSGIDTENDWSISLFPNPSRGEFKLNLTGLKTNMVEITIHNAAGMVVYRKEYRVNGGELKESINIENNSKGIYLIKINDKKTFITRKIVIE